MRFSHSCAAVYNISNAIAEPLVCRPIVILSVCIRRSLTIFSLREINHEYLVFTEFAQYTKEGNNLSPFRKSFQLQTGTRWPRRPGALPLEWRLLHGSPPQSSLIGLQCVLTMPPTPTVPAPEKLRDNSILPTTVNSVEYSTAWKTELKFSRTTAVIKLVVDSSEVAGADPGFYKGWCPIHLKGAPEGAKPPTCASNARVRRGCGAFSRKFENLDTLRCIFPALQGRITNCMIECAFMT